MEWCTHLETLLSFDNIYWNSLKFNSVEKFICVSLKNFCLFSKFNLLFCGGNHNVRSCSEDVYNNYILSQQFVEYRVRLPKRRYFSTTTTVCKIHVVNCFFMIKYCLCVWKQQKLSWICQVGAITTFACLQNHNCHFNLPGSRMTRTSFFYEKILRKSSPQIFEVFSPP